MTETATVRRCHVCRAQVHADHVATHRRYNCRPGLHQPPLAGEPQWGPHYEDDGTVTKDGVVVGRWKPTTRPAPASMLVPEPTCQVCKGTPCALKGTPQGPFIAGAHLR